ncbi:hypothetical protein LIER_10336 [Lithospermum erythrorhizon]|uniref:Putative plant transposon protein domain-containing protein n=1 Tax=Lithospermum erythrorhizon TaxID=34254 RepID=A0AAV3PJ17_LITER
MVKTRGGRAARNRNLRGQTSYGQPIPLQVIPHLNSQPTELLRLPWKENAEIEELNREHIEPIHLQQSDTNRGMNMHVPPTESTTGKNPNPKINFVEREESTETLINPTRGDKEGVYVDFESLEAENEVGEKEDGEFGRMSREGEAVIPSIKDTSCETRYKSARTHSFIEPTISEVLAGLKKTGVMTEKGVRLKRRLRKQRKKKTALGLGGEDVDNSMEPSEAVGLEEMERKAEEKKRIKKGKGKAKRPSEVHASGFASKKRRGVVISDPKSPVRRDRNKINNRRITKDVKEVPIDGVDSCSKEHEVVWKYVCARNILPERYLSEVTYNNQTNIDILQDAGLLSIMSNIEPHWPQLIREFMCNVSEKIADSASSMFHKVKLRGHVFKFSHSLINKHYGVHDEGITGATLKLGDIVGELIRKAFTAWPSKGQLQASSLSLKYAVLHKVSIANLVPISNNTNVSEAVGRVLYVMGSDQHLNIGKVIFEQIVDHSRTGAKLKPIGFPSLICSMLITRYPHVLKKGDGLGEDVKSLTISDKLMKRKDVIDVEFNVANQTEPIPKGEAAEMLIKAYKEEQLRLEAEIQAKKVRLSELQAKIQALKTSWPKFRPRKS